MSQRAASKRGKTPRSPASNTPPATPLPVLRPEPERKSAFTLSWLLSTYIIVLSAGFAILRSPVANVRGNELSLDRAAFTVINAVTLTGFEQAIGVSELRTAGQVAVFLLMTIGTFISLVVGGSLVARVIRSPITDRQIAFTSGIAILIAALLGMMGLRSDCGSAWPGMFAGVSALGNSGMYLNQIGSATSAPTHLVLLPLSVAGGLGIVVLIEIGQLLFRRRALSQHSLVVLSTSAFLYLAGTACILLLQRISTLLSGDSDGSLAVCSAAVLNCRSAGFPLTPFAAFTRASQWVLMGLMIIGAAPGGTGGGLKVTTPLVLWRGVRRTYHGHEPGRAVAVAATWVVAYFSLVIIGLLTLLIAQPEVPTDRLVLLAISAASNVGIAHDPVSIVGTGLWVLGAIALLGRLLPLLVLFWMARAVRGADVAVG